MANVKNIVGDIFIFGSDVYESSSQGNFLWNKNCSQQTQDSDGNELPKESVNCVNVKETGTAFNNMNIQINLEESQTHEKQKQNLENVKEKQTISTISQNLDTIANKIEQLENDFTSPIDLLLENNLLKQMAITTEERAQLDNKLQDFNEAAKSEGNLKEITEVVRKHDATESLVENALLKMHIKEGPKFVPTKYEQDLEILGQKEALTTSYRYISSLLDQKIKQERQIEELRKEIDGHREQIEEQERALELEKNMAKLLNIQMEDMQRLGTEEKFKIEALHRKRREELKNEIKGQRDEIDQQERQLAQEKVKANSLRTQIEDMKRLDTEQKVKIETLMKQKEEIQRKLAEAERDVAQSREEQTNLTELLIKENETLQLQLTEEKKRKNTVVDNMCTWVDTSSKRSAQEALARLGAVLESELQCTVCTELFVAPVTLGCSHTFCRHCIALWREGNPSAFCPICRAPISTECKSLALDMFIDKMIDNLSDDVKQKRKEVLDNRKAEEAARQRSANSGLNTHRFGLHPRPLGFFGLEDL